MTTENPSSAEAVDRMRESWHKQQRLTAEDVFHMRPGLVRDSAAAVDVIYAEILLREEHGETPSENEYSKRFPQFRELIARQFQLHRALAQVSAGASAPTNDGGETFSEADSQVQVSPLIVAGFDIQEEVGRGGSGIAYRAIDKHLKRVVAIKFLQSAGTEHHKQLLREAEAAAALVHPNIVQVHQIGDEAGTPFLVLEFIDGVALSAKLQQGPLPTEEAVDLLIEIATAVQFAHDKGIVHRDLKPGNVLLDAAGVPHVCDFGLARKLDSEFTLHKTGDVVGTPAFMAPEQARGETATTAADVYSLGSVLYHCLTGRPPFQAATPWEILNQVMTDDPVPVCHLNAAIPKDLETICTAAMHKMPERRISSAGEFADELNRLRSGQPIQSRPVGRIERAWKLCRRNPVLSSLVGISAVALAAVAVVSTISEQKVSNALNQTKEALTEAKTQRDVAFSAMKTLVNEVHGNLEKHEASVEARAELLQSAIAGLQKIIDTSDRDSEILMTMAAARAQYGYILAQQGRNEEARRQHKLAVEDTDDIDSDEGRLAHVKAISLLARHYMRVANRESALSTAQLAVDKLELLTQTASPSTGLRLTSAAAHSSLGDSLISLERNDEGRTHLLQARDIAGQLHVDEPDNSAVARQLLDIDMSLANSFFAFAEVGEAESVLQEAIQLIEADALGIAGDTQLYRDYLNCCRLMGLSKFGRILYDDAIETFTIAEQGYQRLIDIEPLRPGFRLKLGVVSGDIARCRLAIGQAEAAQPYVLVAVEQFTKGMELGGPEYRVQRSAIAGALGLLADLEIRADDLDAAAATIAQMAETLEPLIEEYQLQGMVDDLLFRREIIRGLAGHECSADPDSLARARRAYAAWKHLIRGDAAPFQQSETQLLADIDASTNPTMKSWLLSTMSQCYGQQFELLQASNNASSDDIDKARSQAIDSIGATLAAPGADQAYFLIPPEFKALRETEEFRTTFSFK